MLIETVVYDGINIIAPDSEFIRIAIELDVKELIEDKNVFRLFRSLEAWFELNPDGFPRHCDARKDQKKNIGGLSFTEELVLKRNTIKNLLKKICFHYKSKEDFELAEDKFQGGYFYYSVYLQSDGHRTYFYRNHAKFNELKRKWLERLDLEINTEKADSAW